MSTGNFPNYPETWLEEIDLSGDGGCIKRIYVRGDEGAPCPENGQKVHMLYEGRLASDNSVFDKSIDPESAFAFKLGTGQVIKGWDVGVASMTLGERAELVLKPEYAYGEAGAGASIPPNASLIFKVELVQIAKGKKAARYCKSDEQLYAEAQAEKDQGNAFFKEQKFKEAKGKYLEAYELVIKIDKKEQVHHDFRKTLLLNVSVASNKLGEYKATIEKTTEALYIDDKTTKAYFLRAQAHHKLKEYDLAM
jgi:peptidylprolyl isomerase